MKNRGWKQRGCGKGGTSIGQSWSTPFKMEAKAPAWLMRNQVEHPFQECVVDASKCNGCVSTEPRPRRLLKHLEEFALRRMCTKAIEVDLKVLKVIGGLLLSRHVHKGD
eukprot:1018428-Pelagomonas_calceolata.AAC.3